jgi:hypothetical protein
VIKLILIRAFPGELLHLQEESTLRAAPLVGGAAYLEKQFDFFTQGWYPVNTTEKEADPRRANRVGTVTPDSDPKQSASSEGVVILERLRERPAEENLIHSGVSRRG